jgi:plasmid stabilization system protein ParE
MTGFSDNANDAKSALTLEFTRDAIAELENIHARIAEDSLERADKIAAAIKRTCGLLLTSPKMGRPLPDGTRKVTKKPWIIVYDLLPTGPIILHVFDSRQDWQAKLL